MFAIEFNEANLDKISRSQTITDDELQGLKDVFLTRKYVYIRGYYTVSGRFKQWAIVPKFVFNYTFDHNPETIKTDWDQIVRKP